MSDEYLLQWRDDGEYLQRIEFMPGTRKQTAVWGKHRRLAIRFNRRLAFAVRSVVWNLDAVKVVRA